VEETTPSNQMDLDQDIQVINPKDKNFSPEERHKSKMPELPPVPKAGNNRDIPVSVQELVYCRKAAGVGTSAKSLDRHNELLSSCEDIHGSRKDRRISEGTRRRSWREEKKTAQWKHPKLPKQNSASKSAKQGQADPKEQSEGKEKFKGKGKIQVEQALTTELQHSQGGEDSHGQCVQYGKNSDGIKKQGGRKIEPISSNKVDLVKLVIKKF
ncbi:hypothetical protein O181_111023, partial [Austropuccinia psidii MF-1]|nr:hypothetical protein [Austropuccinia psidii MF-1]